MDAQRGAPLVLHFWATWCGPCLLELPELIQRASRLRGDGYRVVTVAVDESWQVLESFFRRHPELRPLVEHTELLLDPAGEIAARFGSARFPETFLINQDGLVDNKLVGPQPWSRPEIEPYLRRLRTKSP